LAYYTLSSRELKLEQLPRNCEEGGQVGYVGVTLLGTMAVAEKCKGTGLGALTLMNALDKSLTATRKVASWAVCGEAIDDGAATFYRKYGFIEYLETSPSSFSR
jgi:hypothetical protein